MFLKNSNLFLFLLIVVIYLSSCRNQDVSDEETLAIVNDKRISKTEYAKRIKLLNEQSGLEPNGQVRRELLKTIINEEVLLVEAKRLGYDNDSTGLFEAERIKIQELLNQFYIKQIKDKISLQEKDLKRLFINLNTKIKARHLYAENRKKADSLYWALQNGASFEKLAKELFSDPVLRNSGGSLGYFTVDEMEPAFEEAAFAMNVGEISKPVKTKDGFSIIKIDDRIVKPLLTENEYNKHRSKLQKYLKERKTKQKVGHFVDSLREELEIVFNEPVIEKIYSAIKEKGRTQVISEMQSTIPAFIDIPNEWIIRFKHGEWDLRNFQQYAGFTSQKQRNWIKNEEALREYITGLVVRSVILQKAKDEGFDDTPQYSYNVDKNLKKYLLKRIEKNLFFDIEIHPDSLYIYFKEEPDRFAVPRMINLRELVVGNKEAASKMAVKLRSGQSFSALARKYSIRETSSQNGGELGFLTPKDLGRWSEVAFSLKKGEWTGPLNIDSLFVFLQCIEQRPRQMRSFEESKDDVEKVVKSYKWHELRREKINLLKKNVQIITYPEKLMTLKLN